MQYKSMQLKTERPLDYSQEAAIFETYLWSLSNEAEAFEVLKQGLHDVVGCIEDALTVISLTNKAEAYPSSVPVALRNLRSFALLEAAKEGHSNSRLAKFLRWNESAISSILDNSKTGEYIPIFLEGPLSC